MDNNYAAISRGLELTVGSDSSTFIQDTATYTGCWNRVLALEDSVFDLLDGMINFASGLQLQAGGTLQSVNGFTRLKLISGKIAVYSIAQPVNTAIEWIVDAYREPLANNALVRQITNFGTGPTASQVKEIANSALFRTNPFGDNKPAYEFAYSLVNQYDLVQNKLFNQANGISFGIRYRLKAGNTTGVTFAMNSDNNVLPLSFLVGSFSNTNLVLAATAGPIGATVTKSLDFLLPADQWHTIVGTMTLTGLLKLRVNGQSYQVQLAYPSGQPGEEYFNIGRLLDGWLRKAFVKSGVLTDGELYDWEVRLNA